MDISLREWLVIIGVLIILAVIIDGVRRMRLGKRDQLQMSRRLGSQQDAGSPLDDDFRNPELPSKGFRVIRRGEDSEAYEAAARAHAAAEAARSAAVEDSELDDEAYDEEDAAGNAEPEDVVAADAWDDEERYEEDYVDNEPFQEHGSSDEHFNADDSMDDDVYSEDHIREDHIREDHIREEELHAEPEREVVRAVKKPLKPLKPVPAREDSLARPSTSSAAGEPVKSETPFRERFLQKMEPVRRMTEKVQAISRSRQPAAKAGPIIQHLTVVNIVSRDEAGFDGAVLGQILEAVGMQRTAQDTFVRHEDDLDTGAVQFTLLNAVEPGVFPAQMESFRTPCVAMLLVLPGAHNPIQAYDYMIEIAKVVVKNCNGELQDAEHSAMTSQTVGHYREKIREFQHKHRSLKV